MVRSHAGSRQILTATVLALLMSGVAWAQSTDEGVKSPITTVPAGAQLVDEAAGDRAAATSQGRSGGDPAPVDEIVIAAQREGQILASELVGAPVFGPDGDEIGHVDDLIFDAEGRLEGAVVSIGGFLGFGDRLVALPWSTVQPGAPGQPVIVGASGEQLEAAPEFRTLAQRRAQLAALVQDQAEQRAASPPVDPASAPGRTIR